MFGTPISDRPVASDWLKFEESSGQRFSRENGVLITGSGLLRTGTVLGLITLGAATAAMNIGNTGNGTITASPTVGAAAVPGTVNIVLTSATAFTVKKADGTNVGAGTGTVGTPFSGGGLGFTVTAGGTPFIAGDNGTVVVDVGSGKYKPYDPDGVDGSQTAAGILVDLAVDATSKDQKCVVVVRDAMVMPSMLIYADGTTDGEKADALLELRAKRILPAREV